MLAKKQILTILLGVASVAFANFAMARRDDDFKEVQTKELVKNPQIYWAQGIIFKDKLVAPPAGPEKKVGERGVVGFQTKVVGQCYADDSLVAVLQEIQPGSDCIFSGTVFQERSWFSSKFLVIVQGVTVSAGGLSNMHARVSAWLTTSSNSVYATTAKHLDFVLSQIQADLLAYSNQQNVPMSELVDPASPDRERVAETVRKGLAKLEEESRMPSSSFLSDLLTAILAERYLQQSAGSVATNTNERPVTMPDAKEEVRESGPSIEKDKPQKTGLETESKQDAKQPPTSAAKKGPESKSESAEDPPERSAVNATPPLVNSTKSATKPVSEERSRPSFWSRLFGTSQKKGKLEEAQAKGTITTNGVHEVREKPENVAAPVSEMTKKQGEDAVEQKTKAEMVKTKAMNSNSVAKVDAPKSVPKKTEQKPSPEKKSFISRLFGDDEKSTEKKAGSSAAPTNAVPPAAKTEPVDADRPIPMR